MIRWIRSLFRPAPPERDRAITVEAPIVTDADVWEELTPTLPVAHLPPEQRPIPSAFDDLSWEDFPTSPINPWRVN